MFQSESTKTPKISHNLQATAGNNRWADCVLRRDLLNSMLGQSITRSDRAWKGAVVTFDFLKQPETKFKNRISPGCRVIICCYSDKRSYLP